jgi:hypothetical protein
MADTNLVAEWGEWALYAEGEGDDRTDQSEVAGDREYPFRNPSGEILVTDPSHLPASLVELLLVPDANGQAGAMLVDRQFTWYPPYTSGRKLKLMFNNSTVKESCAFCGVYFRTAHLQVFWEGRAVCDGCMPVEMRDLRDIGYESAKYVSIEAGGDIGEYLDALGDFADRQSRKQSSRPSVRYG